MILQAHPVFMRNLSMTNPNVEKGYNSKTGSTEVLNPSETSHF